MSGTSSVLWFSNTAGGWVSGKIKTFFSLLLLNLFLAHSKLTCEFKTLNVFNANILTLLPSFIFFKKLVRQLLTTLFFF